MQEEHLINNNLQINDSKRTDNNKVLKKKSNSFDDNIKKGAKEGNNG